MLVRHITKTFTFDAAHQLGWHPGKCRRLHGHTYRLEVALAGDLDDRGVIADFDDVRGAVKAAVLDDYDHSYLNEIVANPTAELLCEDIVHRLLTTGLPIRTVTLWETATCSATITVERPRAQQGPM